MREVILYKDGCYVILKGTDEVCLIGVYAPNGPQQSFWQKFFFFACGIRTRGNHAR